jgi:hypothetical protein
LKIPEGKSETFNRKGTDNTMANRKRTKEHPTIYKTLHRKLMIEQHSKLVVNSGALEW